MKLLLLSKILQPIWQWSMTAFQIENGGRSYTCPNCFLPFFSRTHWQWVPIVYILLAIHCCWYAKKLVHMSPCLLSSNKQRPIKLGFLFSRGRVVSIVCLKLVSKNCQNRMWWLMTSRKTFVQKAHNVAYATVVVIVLGVCIHVVKNLWKVTWKLKVEHNFCAQEQKFQFFNLLGPNRETKLIELFRLWNLQCLKFYKLLVVPTTQNRNYWVVKKPHKTILKKQLWLLCNPLF